MVLLVDIRGAYRPPGSRSAYCPDAGKVQFGPNAERLGSWGSAASTSSSLSPSPWWRIRFPRLPTQSRRRCERSTGTYLWRAWVARGRPRGISRAL